MASALIEIGACDAPTVSKEDETIQKKPVTVSQDAKKSISEYYKAAKDLCDAQSIFMQKT